MTGKSLVLATALEDGRTTSALMHGGKKIGETSETGLVLYHPERFSFEEYEEMGRLIGSENRRLQWVVGDWILLVEGVYPDRYEQAALATRLSPHTIANRASVCRKIPVEERRAGVPFGVHAEVAYLEPAARRRWLDRAEREDWTRAELREHMKPKELPPAGTTTCPTCGQTVKEE